MQPEHTYLLEQLRAVFPAEPIRAACAFVDWGMAYLDVEPYSQHIEGKPWEELDRAYMITRSDALSFLGTRHLIAVLPVYLRSLLEDSVGSPSAETMIPLLTKPGLEKKTGLKLQRFQALVDALTSAQRTVIAAVLRAFATRDEYEGEYGSPGQAAIAALERYWETCLSDRQNESSTTR